MVAIMKKEMDLNGKIRNLQVSISIAKKEIRDIKELLNGENVKDREKKLSRLAVCQHIINTKSDELTPLIAQRPSKSGTKHNLTKEQEQELLKQAMSN